MAQWRVVVLCALAALVGTGRSHEGDHVIIPKEQLESLLSNIQTIGDGELPPPPPPVDDLPEALPLSGDNDPGAGEPVAAAVEDAPELSELLEAEEQAKLAELLNKLKERLAGNSDAQPQEAAAFPDHTHAPAAPAGDLMVPHTHAPPQPAGPQFPDHTHAYETSYDDNYGGYDDYQPQVPDVAPHTHAPPPPPPPTNFERKFGKVYAWQQGR